MIVVKVGGGDGINLDAVCDDMAKHYGRGLPLVLVHGGSHLTNKLAEALDHPPRFVTSPSGYVSRFTDRRTLEIFEMVYCGQLNKGIVERLQKRGVNALGLSGLDGGLWRGPRKRAIRVVQADGRERIIRESLTGRVEKVNAALLCQMLEEGYLPVLTPPALSYESEAINIDGDRAAAATAAALGASELLILTNVAGVMRDLSDETSVIETISLDELAQVTEDVARGRMRIKLLAAREALAGGVQRVVIGDARQAHPISRARATIGTVIVRPE